MRTVNKPWGKEEIWAEGPTYVGKFLYIGAGEKLSRQYHEKKEETICVLEGDLELELGIPSTNEFEVEELSPGDTFHITPGTVHRFCASGGDVRLVEVSSTELEDVVRLEDEYNRAEH